MKLRDTMFALWHPMKRFAYLQAFGFGFLTQIFPQDGTYWVYPVCTIVSALAWFTLDIAEVIFPLPGE